MPMTQYPPLKLYNTESRALENVYPSDGEVVRIYTCGPTVYNYAHIGNFRTYVFEDLLRRTIKFFGMKVCQVMNLTDVDDKTIKGAIERKVTLGEYTAPFKEAFFEDLKLLGIEPVEAYPQAIDYIPSMIELIQTLMEKGIAYRGQDGSIYFSIQKFPSYGRLSHLRLDELKIGASERISDEYDKENAADFVLWKSYDSERDGEIYWDSPFGLGRPGWHIECSAMALKILGPNIDIHAGGVDNIFPHHENEIAQSECCLSERFARIWVHAEHLVVDHKKMSKSAGNFYTLRDLLQRGYTGRQVRLALLSTHYRSQLNFTFQGLDATGSSLERLGDFIVRLESISDKNNYGRTQELLKQAEEKFISSLAEDLNISASLGSLFDLVRALHSLMDEKQVGQVEASEALEFLRRIDRVLGFLFTDIVEETPFELQELLAKRNEARADKNWPLADECRQLILERGYIIEDSPQGSRLKKVAKL